ncbi:MAG: c-type cytochrome [Burkholderiales bacterium]
MNLLAPHNVIQAIRKGGFAPNTAANPRPFGMPPFGHVLTDAKLAAVATHVRRSWGNTAPVVTELQVLKAK